MSLESGKTVKIAIKSDIFDFFSTAKIISPLNLVSFKVWFIYKSLLVCFKSIFEVNEMVM